MDNYILLSLSNIIKEIPNLTSSPFLKFNYILILQIRQKDINITKHLVGLMKQEQTFDIWANINFITIRANINFINRLVNHTLTSKKSHFFSFKPKHVSDPTSQSHSQYIKGEK